MKTVTKWESYEDAKRRCDAKKAEKRKPSLSKKRKRKKLTKGYVSFCGGIQPPPILPPPDKEES